MQNKDPLGYYASLNISPGASREEVRLAYRFLKNSYLETRSRKIDIAKARAAFDTLNDAGRKAAYDRGDLATAQAGDDREPVVDRSWRANWKQYVTILTLVLVVVLAGLVYTFYGAAIRGAFNHFEPGDTLYRKGETAPLGTVSTYEPDHVFPNGASGDAYLVHPAPQGEPRWYPAGDLDRHYEKR